MDNNIRKYSFNNKQEAEQLLEDSRIKIDEIDNKLFELICERTSLAQEIALAKNYLGMNIYDQTREKIIQSKIHKLAKDKDIDIDIIDQIMNMLTILSKNEQKEIIRRVENGKY